MEYTLDEEFLDEYKKMAAEFDKLAVDLFQGVQLEKLALSFLRKHHSYISQFPFIWKTRFPNLSNSESIKEDHEILRKDMDGSEIVSTNSSEESPRQADETPEYAQVIGDVYRRVSKGSYLRLTYNKSRLNQEDDRQEPLDWARYAIRYDRNSFDACGWYMIALGWYLDMVKNPKDRVTIGMVFRQSALRCIWLNPTAPLPHNLLGRYYYSIANLSWFERTIANKLLGFKLEGSIDESEREFLRAHELKNDWLPTGLWLARVLIAQKRPMEEIKRWIDFGLALGANEPTTEIERTELLELEARLKLRN